MQIHLIQMTDLEEENLGELLSLLKYKKKINVLLTYLGLFICLFFPFLPVPVPLKGQALVTSLLAICSHRIMEWFKGP